MSRAPITQADLNAMTHITPTGYAEQGYQDAQARPRAMRTGPAGVAVPSPRSAYRPMAEGKLLAAIVRQAHADYRARELSREVHAAAADALAADIRARHPLADMEVLERYGVVEATATVLVGLAAEGDYEAPHWVDLPQPMMLPRAAANFEADLGGTLSGGTPVPPEVMPYMRKVLAVRRERRSFTGAITWPGTFKAREKRWPRWHEIESAFPLLGAWLAEQRKGSSK